MKARQFIITAVLLLLPLCLWAQEEQLAPSAPRDSRTARTERASARTEGEQRKIVRGFSGGMMVHAGYGFAQNPEDLFRNGSLSAEQLARMSKSGLLFGIGGEMRLHLLNHLRFCSEGYMSTMPFKQGQIRTGWGGVALDGYLTWGKVKPFIALGMGGGSMRRTYVQEGTGNGVTDTLQYNASFTKTPFFYLDPQLGLEFALSAHLNMLIRLDYMLPFSKDGIGISHSEEEKQRWKGYMTPSGPRLYIGLMFNH